MFKRLLAALVLFPLATATVASAAFVDPVACQQANEAYQKADVQATQMYYSEMATLLQTKLQEIPGLLALPANQMKQAKENFQKMLKNETLKGKDKRTGLDLRKNVKEFLAPYRQQIQLNCIRIVEESTLVAD